MRTLLASLVLLVSTPGFALTRTVATTDTTTYDTTTYDTTTYDTTTYDASTRYAALYDAYTSYDSSDATGVTATFRPCATTALSLPVGAATSVDLGALSSTRGGTIEAEIQADGIHYTFYGSDIDSSGVLSLSPYGTTSYAKTQPECFFKHVCAELCSQTTANQTAESYQDGGGGYVLGCIVAEAIARYW